MSLQTHVGEHLALVLNRGPRPPPKDEVRKPASSIDARSRLQHLGLTWVVVSKNGSKVDQAIL